MSESLGILNERLTADNVTLRADNTALVGERDRLIRCINAQSDENTRLRRQVDTLVLENLRLSRRLPIGELVTFPDPFTQEEWR